MSTPEVPTAQPVQPAVPKGPASRGLWFAIGAGSMLLLGLIVGAIGVAYVGWALGDDYEDYAEDDGYYRVRQESVARAVDQPCVAMQDAAKDIALISGIDEGATSLKAFSASVRQIVTAIDGAKPDADAKLWRDDWATIATSVDTYSAALASGKAAEFKLPRTAVGPVTERMYGGVEGCELPMRVTILDPEVANEYYGY